jgi:hypothetical protein
MNIGGIYYIYIREYLEVTGYVLALTPLLGPPFSCTE